jgi:hypothetical protein
VTAEQTFSETLVIDAHAKLASASPQPFPLTSIMAHYILTLFDEAAPALADGE